MTHDPQSESAENDRIKDEPSPFPSAKDKDVEDRDGNAAGRSDGIGNGRDKLKVNLFGFMSRLTINERLTLLVSVGTLVTGVLTWLNASNTTDLKSAINGLTALAKQASIQAAQTKREADALNAQLGDIKRQADAAQSSLKVAESDNVLLGDQVFDLKTQTEEIDKQTEALKDTSIANINAAISQKRLADAAADQTALNSRSIEEANRAWIAPSASIVVDSNDHILRLDLELKNIGREPATDISFPVFENERNDFAGIFLPGIAPDLCNKIMTGFIQSVIYPGSTYTTQYFLNSKLDIPRQFGNLSTDGRPVAGSIVGVAYWIHGCIAYRTEGNWHQSEFCIWSGANSIKGHIDNAACSLGNKAD